jgi:uncharacterized protein YbjT (DUF2867 family)
MRNRLFTLFGGTGFIGRYVVERAAKGRCGARSVAPPA